MQGHAGGLRIFQFLTGNILTDLIDVHSFFAYLRFSSVGQRVSGEHQNCLGVIINSQYLRHVNFREPDIVE
jgi:hypothetical protein